METREFRLEELDCAGCAAKIEAEIVKLEKVSSATLLFPTRKLRVEGEDLAEIREEIQKICDNIEPGVKVSPLEEVIREKMEETITLEQKKEIGWIVFGGVLLFLGILLEHFTSFALASKGVLLVSYLILGKEVLQHAIGNLFRGKLFDENFLMSLATIAAMGLGEFEEAVGVMLFYRIGELFEEIAVNRSRNQIMKAVDLRPETVYLVRNGETLEVDAGSVEVGDEILVRPGDRIPLDGKILKGRSRLDTAAITGESVPVEVTTGDSIYSGCINLSGLLHLQVEKPLKDSMVSRILDMVENASGTKPKMDRFLTRFARVYTPIVVGIAILTAVVPSIIWGNPKHWIYTAVTFLVISCPCALVLSVPLTFFSGIGGGAKRGILFKGGNSIEALYKVNAVVMDKTGTITKGDFSVKEIKSVGKLTSKQILKIAASCEEHSSHPIAGSIVAKARQEEIVREAPIEMEEIQGKGVRARFAIGEVLVGSRKFLEEEGVDCRVLRENVGTEVLVAVEQKVEGYLLISDTVKSDGRKTIEALKQMGIFTAMLTGDQEDTAKEVAKEVGIEEVYAKLLPEEKLERLREIRQRKGSVLYVGDGINDAPVLANADVGAAMGTGADAAMEVADLVFMTPKVAGILESIVIGRRTQRIVVQNVVFALGIKILVMLLGFVGFANMWLAIFADTGVAMLCVLNATRAMQWKGRR